MERKKLEGNTFIFDKQEDLQCFWNNQINKLEDTDVVGNTFIVVENRWLRKIITFLHLK